MYSRKYIRSPAAVIPPAASVLQTGGTVPSPAPSRAEERAVSLPPDYTGMAFSDTRQGGALQNRRDYPETLIAPSPAEAVSAEGEEAPGGRHEALPARWEEEEAPTPLPNGEESTVFAELEEAEEEPIPLSDPKEPETSPAAPIENTAPPTASSSTTLPSAALPLLTPELLRSLTLEDLLLFWMLLMLMVSSQEDQIYLLLGLLLFER